MPNDIWMSHFRNEEYWSLPSKIKLLPSLSAPWNSNVFDYV